MPSSAAAFDSNAAGFAQAGRAGFGQASANGLSLKWSALQDSGNVVAMLAGRTAEKQRTDLRNFPAMIRNIGGWRYEQASRLLDDLGIVMEAGMAALIASNARGAPAPMAAQALWEEFAAAREDILALLPIETGSGAMRRA